MTAGRADQGERWLPTELALAIECCATAAAGRLEKVAGGADWLRFLAMGLRHRVQVLVRRAIERFELGPPDEVASQLAADAILDRDPGVA